MTTSSTREGIIGSFPLEFALPRRAWEAAREPVRCSPELVVHRERLRLLHDLDAHPGNLAVPGTHGAGGLPTNP